MSARIAREEIQFTAKIGSGQYGDVYRGICRGQVVAVKELKPEKMTAEEARKFEGEQRIMRYEEYFLHWSILLIQKKQFSETHNKNIVQYVGFCEGPPMLVVTEYLSQGNLEDVLVGPNAKQFNILARVDMAYQICNGMCWFVHYSKSLIEIEKENNFYF